MNLFVLNYKKYISGIINGEKIYAIYCMPDHTHIFASLKPDIAISDLTETIKSNSYAFIKEKKFVKHFASAASPVRHKTHVKEVKASDETG